jgi:hypothetical protein
VLAALTDPEAIRRWSPVAFELDGSGAQRLRAGSRTGVSGRLAGVGTRFDVEVLAADEQGLRLRAEGPVKLDVEYAIAQLERSAEVRAQVVVEAGAGLGGRILSRAVDGLLAAGVLDSALNRMAAVAAG